MKLEVGYGKQILVHLLREFPQAFGKMTVEVGLVSHSIRNRCQFVRNALIIAGRRGKIRGFHVRCLGSTRHQCRKRFPPALTEVKEARILVFTRNCPLARA